MLHPWPTSATLPLSVLSLLLACSSVGVEQDTASTSSETATTGNGPSSDPTNGPTTFPTGTSPTTGDDSNTTEAVSISETSTSSDPSNATTGLPDPSTGPDTSGTTGASTDSESASASDTSTGGGDSSGSTGPIPEGCVDDMQNGDETDVDCGGSCPACDLDKMCLIDTDCGTLSCEETCVEATCEDGKTDGKETDIDCGGPDCEACLDDESCLVGKDCDSGVCTNKVCQAAACDDKVKNQDESDIDCGGATCDGCGNDKKCVVDDDCANKVCDNDICVAATCSDGVQNGPETGIDCGGPSCAPCQLDGLIINEVDYDQIGTDIGEFIEIYNNTGADVDLSDVHLVLVNGSDNKTYLDLSLAGAGMLKQGAYLVAGSATVVLPPGTPFVKFAKASDNIQNGSPDGIALVDLGDVKLLDAFSYKGPMTMATVTGLGVVSLVEGTVLKTQVGDSNANVGSLIRFPNGNDKNDANTEWIFGKNPTPGAANKP